MHLSDHAKEQVRFFGMHLAMFLLFASLGTIVNFEDLKKIKSQPQGILVLILFQALVVPMVLGLISYYFDLPDVVSIALKILKFSPSGAHSSIAAVLACADLPIVISCIWFSTCVSVLMFPINVLIYLPHNTYIDFAELYQTLGVLIAIIVCGIAFGIFARRRGNPWLCMAKNLLPFLVPLMVTLILYQMIADGKNPIDPMNPSQTIGAILVMFFIEIFPTMIIMSATRYPKTKWYSVVVALGWNDFVVALSMVDDFVSADDFSDATAVIMCHQILWWVAMAILAVVCYHFGWNDTKSEMTYCENLKEKFKAKKRLERNKSIQASQHYVQVDEN